MRRAGCLLARIRIPDVFLFINDADWFNNRIVTEVLLFGQ